MDELKIRLAVFEDMAAIMSLIGQSDMSPDNKLTATEIKELFQ